MSSSDVHMPTTGEETVMQGANSERRASLALRASRSTAAAASKALELIKRTSSAVAPTSKMLNVVSPRSAKSLENATTPDMISPSVTPPNKEPGMPVDDDDNAMALSLVMKAIRIATDALADTELPMPATGPPPAELATEQVSTGADTNVMLAAVVPAVVVKAEAAVVPAGPAGPLACFAEAAKVALCRIACMPVN